MNYFRIAVPLLGIAALISLFLTLPEIQNSLSALGCKTCGSRSPYLPLIGAGYFASLSAVSILFPSFPPRQMGKGGLIGAILLSLVLTTMAFPSICIACLIAHVCHILIWTIWVFAPPSEARSSFSGVSERIFLALFAPVSAVALFGCLNLTFMAYDFKPKSRPTAESLKSGDPIPPFTAQTLSGKSISNRSSRGVTLLNFITPNCPFCAEQLELLNAIAAQFSYEWINITPALSSEWSKESSSAEWVEDKAGELQRLFKVRGYPTLYVLGNDGRIARAILGVQPYLMAEFSKSPGVESQNF